MERSIAHFCRKVSVDDRSFHVLLAKNEAEEGKRGLIKVDIYDHEFRLLGQGAAVKNPCDKWNRKTGVSIAVGRAISNRFGHMHGYELWAIRNFRKEFIRAVLKAYNV